MMFYKLLNAYTRRYSFPHRGLKYFLRAAKWLGIDEKTYTKKLPGNFYMELSPAEHIQQQLFWYGYYEKDIVALIKKILQPNIIFLDIGANIGYFSLYTAISEPTSIVIAFEPVEEIFRKLEENISANNLKNVVTIKAAVGEINEERELYISGPDNQGMSSFRQPENFSGKKETVRVWCLDDWFATSGLSRIDLIKLDVEGSELAALKGMKKALQSFRPALIVEVNPETLSLFNLSPRDVYDYLEALEYIGYPISGSGDLEKPGPNKHSVNVLFVHREKAGLFSALMTSQ
jgi:FkbM family methyltransferase